MRILFAFTILIFVLAGCGTSRKVAGTTEAPKKNQPIVLSEEKEMEFEFMFIEGLKEKMLGNIDRAAQYFNQCLELNPKSAAVMYELANLYTLRGDFMSSRLLLEKAIEINPENKWYKLLLAQIYQKSKQYEQASKIYKQLISSDPANIEYHYMNAMLLTTGEQFNEAIKAYNELEKITGFNDQIAMARQQLYRQMGKSKEAYAEIQRLIQSSPSTPEYYGVMADMYKEDGNMPKALEYYNKVLEVDPTNGFVQFSLTMYHIQNGNMEEAYKHAKVGFADPDVEIDTKIQLYLMLISTPSEMQLIDQQMEELINELESAHPSDSRVYSIHADFLLQRQRKEEGREYVKKALEVDPNNYPSWEQLTLIDNELGDFIAMIEHSRKAIDLFPNQALLYVLNAVAHIQQKDYEQALKVLAEGDTYVVGNNSLQAQFEMYRAESYYNLNRHTEAFEAFEKVLTLDPTNMVAMNNYAYYLSERGEQLEKAEKMSSTVIQAHPDNSTYLDTHAWVLFRKKEYRLAKFYMETALRNGGNESAVIVEHYGDILFMLNDLEGALKHWNQALELGSDSENLKKKIEQKKYIE